MCVDLSDYVDFMSGGSAQMVEQVSLDTEDEGSNPAPHSPDPVCGLEFIRALEIEQISGLNLWL